MNRRYAIGAGAASMAILVMPGAVAAGQDAGSPVETVAGGGAVETPLGLVDFGLTAQAGADGEVTGAFTLSDFTQPGNPTVLHAVQLDRIDVHDEAQPSARQVVGWASAAGQSAPFVLRVVDAGGPGSGEDTFHLYVGKAAASYLTDEEQSICDCTDYSYQLEGMVVRGDIMVVEG